MLYQNFVHRIFHHKGYNDLVGLGNEIERAYRDGQLFKEEFAKLKRFCDNHLPMAWFHYQMEMRGITSK